METSFSEISREPHIPSVSAGSSFAGLLYEFGESLKRSLSVCTPAIVCQYENGSSMAYVRPLVATQEETGSFRMQPMVRVSVLQHQAGSFFIHNPLNVGDTGWLIAADTDTDLVKERNSFIPGEDTGIGNKDETTGKPISNQGPQISENDVLHQFSQGFFIPDKWGGVSIPEFLKDSLVIQQVSPDHSTHGGFALDKDGTIHILSTRWLDDNKELQGGLVDIDLRFKSIDVSTNQPYWDNGSIEGFAHAILKGDEYIKSWEDEFGRYHGGNLSVEKDVSIGGNIGVTGNAHVEGEFQVDSSSLFKQKVVVKTDNKAAIIDPKSDLHKTDARFREVTVVTGFKEKQDKIVHLRAKKMRVLTDMPENTNDVEFEVGEDNSSDDVLVDDKSIKWNAGLYGEANDVDRLSVYGWHDQDNYVSPDEEKEKKLSDIMLTVKDGKNDDEDAADESQEEQKYQIVVRSEKGGTLYYIPIGHETIKVIPDNLSIWYKEDSDSLDSPGDELCIKGWWNKEPYQKTLSAIMIDNEYSDTNEEDGSSVSGDEELWETVVRAKKGGTLYYVPIGKLKTDKVSVFYKEDSDASASIGDELCIKGWWNRDPYPKTLADIIIDDGESDSPDLDLSDSSIAEWETVVRRKKGGTLYYIPLGKKKVKAKPDKVSIYYPEDSESSLGDELCIKGWWNDKG